MVVIMMIDGYDNDDGCVNDDGDNVDENYY